MITLLGNTLCSNYAKKPLPPKVSSSTQKLYRAEREQHQTKLYRINLRMDQSYFSLFL